jgi:hypothetical protein
MSSETGVPDCLFVAVWLLAAGYTIHDAGSLPAAEEKSGVASEGRRSLPPFAEKGRVNYYVVGIGRDIVINEALAIRFVDVTEDSRCPDGVVCAWSGRASLATLVTTQDKPKKMVFKVLGMNRWPPTGEIKSSTIQTLDVDGHKITLMDLAPYPVHNQPRNRANYWALFYIGPNPPSFDTGPSSPSLK